MRAEPERCFVRWELLLCLQVPMSVTMCAKIPRRFALRLNSLQRETDFPLETGTKIETDQANISGSLILEHLSKQF